MYLLFRLVNLYHKRYPVFRVIILFLLPTSVIVVLLLLLSKRTESILHQIALLPIFLTFVAIFEYLTVDFEKKCFFRALSYRQIHVQWKTAHGVIVREMSVRREDRSHTSLGDIDTFSCQNKRIKRVPVDMCGLDVGALLTPLSDNKRTPFCSQLRDLI